jgi:hypothetical protein
MQSPRIGEVASGSPRDQDLDPRPPVLLEQHDPAAALGRMEGREQPRGTRPQDRHVVVELLVCNITTIHM